MLASFKPSPSQLRSRMDVACPLSSTIRVVVVAVVVAVVVVVVILWLLLLLLFP